MFATGLDLTALRFRFILQVGWVLRLGEPVVKRAVTGGIQPML